MMSILLMLTVTSAGAQSFTARVSKSHLSLGENFQLVFELQGDGSAFVPPSLDDFMLLSGPNKSSSMQWINGNFSANVSYSFVLKAIKEGSHEIGPARITVDGKELTTETITIKVEKGSAGQQQGRNQQSPPNASQKNNHQDAGDQSSNAFLKLYVDDHSVHVGEQLLATYKLYLNANVVDYNASNLVFNGFYAEEIAIDGSSNMSTEVINNTKFNVYTLKQTLLTPQKPGKLEIPSLEMNMVLRIPDKRRSRSIFDQVFGNFKDVRFTAKSNTEIIEVLPLPGAGQPADFSGAVGKFSLNAMADRTEVGLNEAINFSVKIEGVGNLELIGTPEITFPSDFEVYEPKLKSNISHTASGSRGSKVYEYVLIPRFAGEYNLKPVVFTYFDPASTEYKKVSSPAMSITVLKGDGSAEASGMAYRSANKTDVQIIGKDIRYIHTEDPGLKRNESGFFGSTLFYMLSSLPLIAMAAAIFLISMFRAQQSDTKSLKSRRAGKMAKKHLAKARKLLDGDDHNFYDAISLALFGYISDKLSIPQSTLNRERIEVELRSRNVNDELQQALKKALDECEMVRFAPGVVRGKDEMLASSAHIIEALEDEL